MSQPRASTPLHIEGVADLRSEPFKINPITVKSSQKDFNKYLTFILHTIDQDQFTLSKSHFDIYYNVRQQKFIQQFQQIYNQHFQPEIPAAPFVAFQDYPHNQRRLLASTLYPDLVEKNIPLHQLLDFYNYIPKNFEQTQIDNQLLQVNPRSLLRVLQFMLFKCQLQLFNLKIHLYNKMGLQHLTQTLTQYLSDPIPRSNIFQLDQDNHDVLLYSAFSSKINGRQDQALDTLEKAINLAQTPQDKKDAYRMLARYQKYFNLEAHLVLNNYYKALGLAQMDRTQIKYEIQSVTNYFSQQGGPQAYNSLLTHFDQQISLIETDLLNQGILAIKKEEELKEFYIKKAGILRKMGNQNLAISCYEQAVQTELQKSGFQRSQLIKKQAYFLLQMGREEQSIDMFRKSQELNVSEPDVQRFIQKINKLRRVPAEEHYLLAFYILNFYKKLPDYLLFNSKDVNEQIVHYQNCLQMKELDYMWGSMYKKLANCYKSLGGNHGKQMIQSYDEAFQLSFGHAKTSIYYQRKTALVKLLKNEPSVEYHRQLLQHIDQKIFALEQKIAENHRQKEKEGLKICLTQIIVQKADILRMLGAVDQAIRVYESSLYLIQPSDQFRSFLAYEGYIKFLFSVGRHGQIYATYWHISKKFSMNLKAGCRNRFLVQMLQFIEQTGDQFAVKEILFSYLSPPWETSVQPLERQVQFYVFTENMISAIETLRKLIEPMEQWLKQNALLEKKPNKYAHYWSDDYGMLVYKINQQVTGFQKHQLYDWYMKMAYYLEIREKHDIQILKYLDKAAALYKHASIWLNGKRFLTIFNILNSPDNYRGNSVILYLTELQQDPSNDFVQIMNKKIDCFLVIKDFQSAILHSQQLIHQLNNTNSTFYTQSKIWLKLAYIFKAANNLDDAFKCIDKCIDINPDNVKEKYKFLCHLHQNQEAKELIKKSSNKKSLLIEKGRIFYKIAQKMQFTPGQSRQQQQKLKNKMIKESIEAFDQAILLSDNYYEIKQILQEQKDSYFLQSQTKEYIKKKQDQFLKKTKNSESFRHIEQSILPYYGHPSFLQRFRKQHEKNQGFPQWKSRFAKTWAAQNKVFSIGQLVRVLESNNQRCGPLFVEQIMDQILLEFWKLNKYKEAFYVFRSLVFFQRQNRIISQYYQHELMCKCYEILRHFEQGDYEQALNTLLEFKKDKSDEVQSLISGSLYQASNLAVIMQKIHILCIWHLGNYEQASRRLADLVFTTGKFVQFINPKRFRERSVQEHTEDVLQKLQNPETYVALIKYNSLKYSRKKGDYKECLRKSQDLELYMKNQIKDVSFHINYAYYYANMADSLYASGNIAYVEPYCLFMKKFNKIWADHPEKRQNIAQLADKHRKAEYILKQLFSQSIKQIQFNVVRFKNLCNASRDQDQEINFEKMKNFMASIDQKFMICINITNHGVVSQIERTAQIKNYWRSICKVIFQDILRRNVDDCYSDMKKTIEQVRKQLRSIVVISRKSLTSQIIFPERAYYESQIQAIIDDKITRSQQDIKQAQSYIKSLIEKIEIQQEENQNIYDRINDIEQSLEKVQAVDSKELIKSIFNSSQFEREGNPFITDMLKILEIRLKDKVSFEELKQELNKVQLQIRDQINSRPNESIEKIRQEFRRIEQRIDGFRNLPMQNLNKQFLLQTMNEEQTTTIEGKRFKDLMEQVLTNAQNFENNNELIEFKLRTLESKIQNKANIFDLNDNLTELHNIIDRRLPVEQQNKFKNLIESTSTQNSFSIKRVQENFQEAIDRNFYMIKSLLAEEKIQEKMTVQTLKQSVRTVKFQVSIIQQQCAIIKHLQETVDKNQQEMISLCNKMSQIDSKLGNRDFSFYVETRARINENNQLKYNGIHQIEQYKPITNKNLPSKNSLMRPVIQDSHKFSMINPEIANRRYVKDKNQQTQQNSSKYMLQSLKKQSEENNDDNLTISRVYGQKPEENQKSESKNPSGVRIFKRRPISALNKNPAQKKEDLNHLLDYQLDSKKNDNKISKQMIPTNIQQYQNQPSLMNQRPSSGIRVRPVSSGRKKNTAKKEEIKKIDDMFGDFQEGSNNIMSEMISRKTSKLGFNIRKPNKA